jgi:tetratricopeptide (TPR) repeat protein
MAGRWANVPIGSEGHPKLGTRGRIFISYRRGDVASDASRLYDRLIQTFGTKNVFMDIDKLLAGQRFDRELEKALSRCNVLVVVIGERWMELLAERSRSDKRDFVLDEIAAAVKRGIVIIPVLVGWEGHMPYLPHPEDLPADIRDLVLYQKYNIANETFSRDVDSLTAELQSVLRGAYRTKPWRAIASLGALGLMLIATFLAYKTDMTSRYFSIPRLSPVVSTVVVQSDPGTNQDAADEIARKKIQADELAKSKSVNDETKKMAELAAADCDRLAASSNDPTRPKGVAGVELTAIDTAAATTVCDNAMHLNPDIARLPFQAGRAAQARKDYTKAAELYREGSAKGSASATAGLGYLYHRGYDMGLGIAKPNLTEARDWYEKAAALNNVTAMYDLGVLYEMGGEGLPKNTAKARQWYQKASDNGSQDAKARLKNLN